jgi:uncharacterized membrane protein
MITGYILFLIGVILIVLALAFAFGHHQEKSQEFASLIGILFFSVFGICLIYLAASAFTAGTAHNSAAPGMEIPDGAYLMESDLISSSENEDIGILLVPITDVQNNTINVKPTYWSFPKGKINLPLEKGDIIEARKGTITKSNFLARDK